MELIGVKTVLQNRTETAADWTAVNPVLASGEIGVESDTGLFKIGDGATEWTGLRYAFQFREETITVEAGVATIPALADRTIYRVIGRVSYGLYITGVEAGWSEKSMAHIIVWWGADETSSAPALGFGTTGITKFADEKPEANTPCEINIFNNKAIILNDYGYVPPVSP